MNDNLTSKEMLHKLRSDASTGLDLSPGDPVAAWAVGEIERLQKLVAELEIQSDVAHDELAELKARFV